MARVKKIDNFDSKRFKKQTQKKSDRTIKCKILIVCEGEKTEPDYFESFKKVNFGKIFYDLDVVGAGMNTMSVVNRAIDLSKNKPYDRVWAVFDRDSFSSRNFNGAIIKARENNILCAWSNEAFELWYLLHFQYRNTAMSRTEYKQAISDSVNSSTNYKAKKIYSYQKSDASNYNTMNKYGSLDDAIRNAENLRTNHTKDEKFAGHNPCTTVDRLVLQLIGKDDVLNEELKLKVNGGAYILEE